MAFSCEKNDNDSIPVEFKLRVLNEQGIENKTFNEGENIIFSFLVINKSTETIFVENFFPNEDFFRVYQYMADNDSINHGIPYESVILVGSFNILVQDTLKIEYPWNNADIDPYEYPILSGEKENPRLSRGDYITYFTQTFKIGNIQTEEKYFEFNFTIN